MNGLLVTAGVISADEKVFENLLFLKSHIRRHIFDFRVPKINLVIVAAVAFILIF